MTSAEFVLALDEALAQSPDQPALIIVRGERRNQARRGR